MADKVITATGDCSACCGGEPPAECACALQMPPAVETLFNNFGGVSVIMDDGQFIDYTEAAAAIADFVSNCIGWLWFYSQNAGNINSFSATNPASDTLILASNVTSAGDGQPTYKYASITVPAGCTLAVTYTIGADGGAFFNLYACDDFSTFYFQEAFIVGSGSFSTPALAEGTYIIEILTFEGSGGVLDSSMTIVGDADFVVNPAIALWDDSGTTRQLEACPRLEIPPFNDYTPRMFPDLATASDEMANQVFDCLMYMRGPIFQINSASAIMSGGDLILDSEVERPDAGGFTSLQMLASLNLVGGDTLSLAYVVTNPTVSIFGYAMRFAVYDAEWNELHNVDTLTASGTLNWLVPYTGKFTVYLASEAADFTVMTSHCELSSSGTLTANPVQALYAIGAVEDPCEDICSSCADAEAIEGFCNGCEEPFPEGFEALCADACEALTHCGECDCEDPPEEGSPLLCPARLECVP